MICRLCGKQFVDVTDTHVTVCSDCVKRFCHKPEHNNGCCCECKVPHQCQLEADKEICPICRRWVPYDKWEHHHLIPKSKGGKQTIPVCVNCGDMIHKVIDLKDLKTTYNSPELLRSHPDIQKWIGWIQKKPHDFSICMKTKKRHN